MKIVLTIAGSDPTCRAGVQQDIRTLCGFGVLPLSAVTALTVQGSRGVRAVEPVKSALLKKQLDCVLKGTRPHAVKVGMLANAGNVEALLKTIKSHKLENIVLDTVFASSSGHPLLDKKGISAFPRLFPFTLVVTPNLSEASVITGMKVRDINGMEKAAYFMRALGAKNVLVKGGHLAGAPVDVLFDGRHFYHLSGKRLKATDEALHGTGCMLSSAIAAGVARGKAVLTAVAEAKVYVEGMIRLRKG